MIYNNFPEKVVRKYMRYCFYHEEDKVKKVNQER